MPIRFFYEEIEFKLPNPAKTKKWLTLSAKREKRSLKDINYVFCSDPFLLRINQDYLGHNTLTDIITFDESDKNTIAGEIYISIDRVAENAHKYGVDFLVELRRVMIHGVLHLCGFKDKKADDKTLMREKERAYLSLWEKLFHVKR
jgi:probable rRNA maturation factor